MDLYLIYIALKNVWTKWMVWSSTSNRISMRKVAPKKMRMILMMREISHVSNIQYYNSEKDKKRTDAKHIINFFFFFGDDFDGTPQICLPANCFFNNNDDCVSDI